MRYVPLRTLGEREGKKERAFKRKERAFKREKGREGGEGEKEEEEEGSIGMQFRGRSWLLAVFFVTSARNGWK